MSLQDPMMEELCKIRDDIGATVLSMAPEERIRWYQEQSTAWAEQQGYSLVPHPDFPNALCLVRK